MLASDHIDIFASDTHNLGDEDHENSVVDAYRQFHEDQYVERHYEYPTDE